MTTAKLLPGSIFTFLLAIPGTLSGQAQGIPAVDLHVHMSFTPGRTLDERYMLASNLSKKMGVVFGIAEEPGDGELSQMGKTIDSYRKALNKYPLYLGLQVLRAGWTSHYSKETLGKVDYVMADAMIMPVDGKNVAIWTREAKFANSEDFMKRYMEYHLKVFEEPIDIWCNATYLPDNYKNSYDELWTDARMKTLIDAAVKNNIAIEINSSFQIPSKKFIMLAKAAGTKFSIGSNYHDKGIGDIAWSINMAKECGLTGNDFFMPARQLSDPLNR